MTRVILVLCLGLLMVSTAAAQNVDFDAAGGSFLNLAYGIGAKSFITGICAYLFAWGLGHQHLWVSFCAVMLAVGYWGMGALLGRMGIAFDPQHVTAFAMAIPLGASHGA